jgi:hypothetical protein
MTTAGEYWRKQAVKEQLARLDRDEARETSAPAGTAARCKARLASLDGRAPTVTRAAAKARLAAADARAGGPGPVGRTSTTSSASEYRRVVRGALRDGTPTVCEFVGRLAQRAEVDAHADAMARKWAARGLQMEVLRR